MATVYRRKELRPIPDGATMTTYRGQPHAVWTDGRGKARRAPLNEAGDRIVRVADTYTMQYFDAEGKRCKAPTGSSDKAMAERMAAKKENEVALRKHGFINAEQEKLADAGRQTVARHLDDFEAGMVTSGRTAGHVVRTIGYIRKIADVAGFATLADITADGVNRYASDLMAVGKSARTVQARLAAIKSFTKWLMEHGKLPRDPLASIKTPNPAADRRHERRMLLPEEWTWLRWTTAAGSDRFGMTGPERMLLYAVAIQTGLRANECRSLTRGRLFLAETPPYIVCKARSTKNKKDAKQYLQAGLAAELARHVAGKTPAAPVFGMPAKNHVCCMLLADLADSRREWLSAARGPEERLQREQSDFLCPVNHEGERLDFHALRHTTGAWLAMNGEHPKTIQTVMRHSMMAMTMDTYGHLFPGRDSAAVAALPDILKETSAAGPGGTPVCVQPVCVRRTGRPVCVRRTGRRTGRRFHAGANAGANAGAVGSQILSPRCRNLQDGQAYPEVG